MAQNYKSHAVAIAIICVVITLLYVVMGPSKQSAPATPDSPNDRSIEIYSATWGMNCNAGIAQAIAERQSAPPEKDEKGVLVQKPALTRVTSNNVLTRMSSVCNGKVTCDVTPTSDLLGVEPLAACAKTLEIGYRCFSYDRLWNLSIAQGVTKTIDCHESAATSAK